MSDSRATASRLNLPSAILDDNLAALRSVDAAAAERLLAAAAAACARPETTRDGGVSLVRRDADGERWLGRTSLPAARANGLLAAFQHGNGNVLLYGCGGGGEVVELLRRMDGAAALFVVEPDEVEAALMLRLRDVSAALSARRLVLCCGAAAWERLAAFLAEHAGYLPPQRVLAWPWLTVDETHEVTTRLTSLAAEVGERRASRLAALRASPYAGDAASWVMASASADADLCRLARGLTWGANLAGLRATAHAGDHPAAVHPLALAETLQTARAGAVLLVNAAREDFGAVLPREIACATWALADADGAASLAARATAGDVVVVSDESQAGAARRSAAAGVRVAVLPPAATVREARERRGVIVLADGGDVRPEAAGLHLKSHVALWEAAESVLREGVDGLWPERVERCFERAADASGVRIADAEVRRGLLERVRAVLAPAVLNRAFVDALLDAPIEFDLYGIGWPDDARARAAWRGARPDGAIGYRAAVVLDAQSPGTLPAALDAVAAGAAAVVRSDGRGLPGVAAGLGDAGADRFATRAELVARIRALDGAGGAARGAAMAERVRREHTWRERIAALRDILF